MFARLIACVGLDWFVSLGFVLAVARFSVCGSGCAVLRALGVFVVVLFDSVYWWCLGCWFVGWAFVDVGISFCGYYTTDFAAYGWLRW